MEKLNIDTTVKDVEQLIAALRFALECAESFLESNTTTEDKEPETELKECSFEELRALLATKSRAGFTDEVKALINKFGGSKLSDIDESKYQSLYAEAERINNE